MGCCRDQPWLGNVRELKHVVERTALFADVPVIDVETLRAVLDDGRTYYENAHAADNDREALRRVTRGHRLESDPGRAAVGDPPDHGVAAHEAVGDQAAVQKQALVRRGVRFAR